MPLFEGLRQLVPARRRCPPGARVGQRRREEAPCRPCSRDAESSVLWSPACLPPSLLARREVPGPSFIRFAPVSLLRFQFDSIQFCAKRKKGTNGDRRRRQRNARPASGAGEKRAGDEARIRPSRDAGSQRRHFACVRDGRQNGHHTETIWIWARVGPTCTYYSRDKYYFLT